MRFASIAAWLCAPVVGLTVTALAVNVPMFDEWTWAPLVLAMHDGQLRAADLWAQQQAHRSVLPTALMLALARFDGWDVRIEAAVNLALALATQVLLWRLFARVPQTRRGPAFLVASLLLFSLLQSENWLWGFQLSWFAVNLFVVAVVALLCAPAAGRAAFTAAAVAAIGASLSLIFGFGAWVAGIVALVGRRRRLGVWIAIALALAGVFAIGYHPPRFENGWAHRAPLLDVPQFVLAYLGAPAGALGGRWVAEAAGLLLLIAWFRLVPRARRAGIDARPWIALGAFVATAAAFEAIGRAGNGVDAALAFRYTTPSSLGWIAVVGLAAQTASPRGWRTGMIAVIVAVVTSDVFGYLYAYSLAGLQRDAFAAIHRLDRVDDEELGEYTADPATVRALAARLRAARLGPFAHDGR